MQLSVDQVIAKKLRTRVFFSLLLLRSLRRSATQAAPSLDASTTLHVRQPSFVIDRSVGICRLHYVTPDKKSRDAGLQLFRQASA
jgi:hypothetical protein